MEYAVRRLKYFSNKMSQHYTHECKETDNDQQLNTQ